MRCPTLDELDAVMTSHARHWLVKAHWTNLRDTPRGFQDHSQCTFLALAVQSRLVAYVNDKLSRNPELLEAKRGRSLLDYALRPKRVTPADLPYRQYYEGGNIDVRMVKLLLDFGADCNQRLDIFQQHSVWQLFLMSCVEVSEKEPTDVKRVWAKAIELLLEAGADPTAIVLGPHVHVDDALRIIFRKNCGDALQLLEPLLDFKLTLYQNRYTGPSTVWRLLGWS